MTSKLVWAAAVAMAVAGGAGQPTAECAAGTVCEEYIRATHVFHARVAQVTPDPADRSLGPIQPQTVTFGIIEDFKGMSGGSLTLTFDPAAVDARVFTPGETVLVYARPGATRLLSFAGCSRTRRIAPDDPELVTLRQLQSAVTGASLEGVLQLPPDVRPPAAPRGLPLDNLSVTLQPLDGSESIVAVTAPSGYFLIPWVKPGAYRVRFDAPAFVPVLRDIVVGEQSRCQTIAPIPVRPR